MTKKLELEEATCPICGMKYHYIKGCYKPSTCNNFTCLYKHLHSSKLKGEESNSRLQQRIDIERQRLGDKL